MQQPIHGNSNKVELVGYYGGDFTHACSAWTSTGRNITAEKRARIPALLKQLATGSDGNPHGSPFEKSIIHFLVTCDIASDIHLLKHRIGVSINGESARYRTLDQKYYIPHDWPVGLQDDLSEYCESAFAKYEAAIEELVNLGYSRSRAKESARFYLPYGIQTVMDVSFNFRSFCHFLKLRNAPHAQLEIREIAAEMLRLVKTETDNAFQYSLEAFGL